jgi:periplasmic protein TonB
VAPSCGPRVATWFTWLTCLFLASLPRLAMAQVEAPAPPASGALRIDHRIGVTCSNQVAPILPLQAIRDGIEGTVTARARIKGGIVTEVTILSGPEVFHSVVITAMKQYRCTASDEEVVATQSFTFKPVSSATPPAN